MFAIGTAGIVQATESPQADGASAMQLLNQNAKSPAIMLRTRVAVAGSRIAVTIDPAKKPVFNHVFSRGECKFDDGGSACEVVIAAKSAGYSAILAGFKRGGSARIAIENAGVKKVEETVALGTPANQ
jgi:hypothetical protein